MIIKSLMITGIYMSVTKWIYELFNLTKHTMKSTPDLTPKKYYLGIGLASVDPSKYYGWDGKLGGTIPDVLLFEKQLSLRGFETERVLNEEATHKNVVKKLNDYATKSKAGDTVCIVYSGHGGNIRDNNGDETDNMDETWFLWDKQLLDDDIWKVLKKFKEGVKVILFSDSCHSGTTYRNTLRVRKETTLILKDEGELKCHLKYFGGCQDMQFSADLGTNGLFTRTFWNTIFKSRGLTYDSLYQRLVLKMPPYQRPSYHNLGTQIESFNKELVFS